MVNISKKQPNKFIEPRINDEITGYGDVRVSYIDNDGVTKSEVMSLRSAQKMADDMELDLIEINPKTNPPIMKIAQYSKYLYELKKQLKQKAKVKFEIKEIQLSTNISEHDLGIKAKKASDFISKGDKVRVVLTMRGRELGRREESKRSILEFITKLSDVATPESMPRDEGNKCIVILKKKN